MEHCENGDLRELILKREQNKDYFSQLEALSYLYQLARSIREIHRFNILHRDLKPENFFISADQTLKLGDFGTAKPVQLDQQKTADTTQKVGTDLYMSPELLTHDGNTESAYSTKSDVWGLGMLFVEILTLDYAFQAESKFEIVSSISQVKNLRPIPEIYPEEWKDLVL